MADTQNNENQPSSESLAALTYKQLQQIAMSLRLPANLKQSQLVTIIEAHRSQDGVVVERILSETRELRSRGRAVCLRSSSTTSPTSSPQESPTWSHSDSPPASSRQSEVTTSFPVPSLSPEDLTCTVATLPDNHETEQADKNNNEHAPAASTFQTPCETPSAEDTAGLLSPNLLLDSTDTLEDTLSCPSSLNNSLSSSEEPLVRGQADDGKECVAFTELKPVPPADLLDLSTPLIEESLEFSRHSFENNPACHDDIFYPHHSLAQELVPYAVMAEDAVASSPLGNLVADFSSKALKRPCEDVNHDPSKSRKMNLQLPMSLVATLTSMSCQQLDEHVKVNSVESIVSANSVATALVRRESFPSNLSVVISQISTKEVRTADEPSCIAGNRSDANPDVTKSLINLTCPPSSNQKLSNEHGIAASSFYLSSDSPSVQVSQSNSSEPGCSSSLETIETTRSSNSSASDVQLTPSAIKSSAAGNITIVAVSENSKTTNTNMMKASTSSNVTIVPLPKKMTPGARASPTRNAVPAPQDMTIAYSNMRVSAANNLISVSLAENKVSSASSAVPSLLPRSQSALAYLSQRSLPNRATPLMATTVGANTDARRIVQQRTTPKILAATKPIRRVASNPAPRRLASVNKINKKPTRVVKLNQDFCLVYPQAIRQSKSKTGQPKLNVQLLPAVSTADSTETYTILSSGIANRRPTHNYPEPSVSLSSARLPATSVPNSLDQQHPPVSSTATHKDTEPPSKSQVYFTNSNQEPSSNLPGISGLDVSANIERTSNTNTSSGSTALPSFNNLYKDLSESNRTINQPRMSEHRVQNLSSAAVSNQSLPFSLPPTPYVPTCNSGSHLHLREYGSHLGGSASVLPVEPIQTDYMPSQYLTPVCSAQNWSSGTSPWLDSPFVNSGSGNYESKHIAGSNFQPEYQSGSLEVRSHFTASGHYGDLPGAGQPHFNNGAYMQNYPGIPCRNPKQHFEDCGQRKTRDFFSAQRLSGCLPKKLEFLLNHRAVAEGTEYALVPKYVPPFRTERMDYVFVTSGVMPTHLVDCCDAPICSVRVKSGSFFGSLNQTSDHSRAPQPHFCGANQTTDSPRVPQPYFDCLNQTNDLQRVPQPYFGGVNQTNDLPRVPQPHMSQPWNYYQTDLQTNRPTRIQSPFVNSFQQSAQPVQPDPYHAPANWGLQNQQIPQPSRTPMHHQGFPSAYNSLVQKPNLPIPNNTFCNQLPYAKSNPNFCKQPQFPRPNPNASATFNQHQFNSGGYQSPGVFQQPQHPTQQEPQSYPCQPHGQNFEKPPMWQESQNIPFPAQNHFQEQVPQQVTNQDQSLNQCQPQTQQDFSDLRGRPDQLSLSMIYSYLASSDQLNVSFKENQQGGPVESTPYLDNQAPMAPRPHTARPMYGLNNGPVPQNQATWGTMDEHSTSVQTTPVTNADCGRVRSNYAPKSNPRRQQTPENTTVTREAAHASVAAVRKSVCKERQKCVNFEKGCTQILPLSQLNLHESSCDYKTLNCPKETCDWNGRVRKLASHIRETHRAYINTGSDSRHLLELQTLQALQDVCFLQEVSRKLFAICVSCKESVLYISIQYIASGRSERPTVACGCLEVLGKDGQPRSWRGKLPPYQQSVEVLRGSGSCLEVCPEALGAFADPNITLHVSIRVYSGNTNVNSMSFGNLI